MASGLERRLGKLESRVRHSEPIEMSESELRDWMRKFGTIDFERELSDDEISRCYHLLIRQGHTGVVTESDLLAVEDYEQLFAHQYRW